jgi:hypothetical protein
VHLNFGGDRECTFLLGGGGAQFLWGVGGKIFWGVHTPRTPQIILPCRQRQQHRCQEIFNKISLQEFSCILQEIFVIFYTGMPNNLIIVKTPKEYHCKFITMHCVCLGVMRQFVHLWMDTKQHEKPYYIGRRESADSCPMGHHTFSEMYICRKFYIWLTQEIFVIFYTGMPNNLIIVKTPKEYHKFFTMCDTIRSLKCTYAGNFIFDSHRKFLFLDFAARKRNIFSRPM